MPKSIRSLALVLLCLSSVYILRAQQTSSVIISVTDPNGNIVVGAATILSGENSAKRDALSSELGVISFRGIPAGKYTFNIKVDGFKEFTSQPIELRQGESKRLDIILELASIESNVDVSQSDAVDPTSSGGSRDLKKEEIETLPNDPEELKRVLQAIAGPTLTGDEMQITVNGIPGATLPNKENIKLIRINRNVFSSQYEYSYGGGIEIYTDSDIKKFRGSIGFSFSDSRLNATNPFIGRRVPFQSKGISFSFSAPLRKNLSISGYSSFNDSVSNAAITAVALDQNFQPVDIRDSFESGRRSSYSDFYINWDPNKKNKFVGNLSINYDNGINLGSGFSLASRANDAQTSGFAFAFTETYIITPEFVNTTRFSSRIDKNRSKGVSSASALNVSEAFLGGGSQTDQETTNSRFEIYNDTTKKLGRLNIGFGGAVRGYRIKEISRSNFGGTYTFSGRTAPVLDANFQPVLDPAGNVVTEQITSLESYRRTLVLRNLGLSATQIRSLGGGAEQFTISGGQPEISVDQVDYSFYQQNNFGLSETTGISFGLRYENQSNISSRTNFAPRFGFTWAPKAKVKQRPETTLPRITLGYGIFYNRFGIGQTMSELQANSPDRSFYFVTDAGILDQFPDVPTVAALQQTATLRSLRSIDDELEAPFQNIINLNVAKNLWSGMSVNVGFTRVNSSRSILTRNINAPLASPVGAPLVYPLGNSRNTYEIRSAGKSRSDRVFISVNLPPIKVFGKPGNIGLWYNYGKINSDVVQGSGSTFDPYDFSREWGRSPADGVHAVFGYFQFSLPKSFYLRGDYNIRTGSRFNIITGRDTNRDGIYAERPAFATDPLKPGVIDTPYGLLDPNPAPGAALIPRNLARGSGGAEVNMYLSKSFGFAKNKANKNQPTRSLNFGVWVNNVFNKNNKGNPVGNMSSPNFLRVVSGSNFDGEFRQSSPRRMQFSTSFSF